MTKHKTRLEMIKSWATHDAAVYQAFMNAMTDLGCLRGRESVLNIGCGANAPMTLILHSAGVKATGIDTYIGYRWGLGFKPMRYWHYLQEAGLRKTARKIIGEWVYDRHYYIALANAVGFPLTEKGIDLQQMNAETLQFGDSAFDAIYSSATWEHFADVRRANQEIARVLRPGGIAYIETYLFPSLSGGHDLPWLVPGRTGLGGISPWRHLRDPSWRSPVYLNRLPEQDYHRLFEETSKFEIVEWKTEFTEGEELITDEILQELPDYTRKELTKRSIIVILCKQR